MRFGLSLPVTLAIASALILASCDGDDGTSTTSTFRPPPAPAPPPPTRTSPPSTPPAAPTAPQTDVRYPLTQHQAYESAQAGRVVVGKSPRGEIQIAKSTILVGERRPQQKCEPEYDSYSGEYETKCKTVYELERVPKTVYFTSGPPGEVTRQFDNVAGAFAYAGRMGATTAWRLHQ